MPEKMEGKDAQADDGRQAGGKYGAEHPHAQREDEQVIQHHVGQAAGDHGGHGELGIAVVSHKADYNVIEQKGGRKQQQGAQIGFGHGKDGAVRPQKPGNGLGKQKPRQHKDHRQHRPQQQGMGENLVDAAGLLPPQGDGILGGASHSQHQSGAVDEVVHRNGQIQGGEAVGPQPLGHKEGIGQNVAGQAHHPQYIKGSIPGVLCKTAACFHDFSSQQQKTPLCASARPNDAQTGDTRPTRRQAESFFISQYYSKKPGFCQCVVAVKSCSCKLSLNSLQYCTMSKTQGAGTW